MSGLPVPGRWPEALRPAGDEAVLPAGSTLATAGRATGKCFVLLEGSAVAEAGGRQVRDLAAGSFVGSLDAAGLPLPPSGVTVRLTSPARVLVLDAARLSALIDADAGAAAAWRALVRDLSRTRDYFA